MAIRYFNTNEAIFGSSRYVKTVGLAEAIIRGQAPDGGLYMPAQFPAISPERIALMGGMRYPQIFVETMKDFFYETLHQETLERIAHEAYDFEPYVEHVSGIDKIVRLDEGPTAAFKDYAAVVFFRIVKAIVEQEQGFKGSLISRANDRLDDLVYGQSLKDIDLFTYFTATSGDTGSATGMGCVDVPGMMMFIFYSSRIGEHVSDTQARMMDFIGKNVYVIRADTDFDGCDLISKTLQMDPDLAFMHKSTANSVSLGRLLPQVAYYFYAYSRVAENGEEIRVSVPSGNFGDAMAGLFSMKMGLPIKLIVGVNENDVFERFIRTGMYAPSESTKPCHSNSMNVGWPSNVRRVFNLYGGQLVEGKDPETGKRIVYSMKIPDLKRLRADIAAYAITDDETDGLIWEFYNKRHLIDGRIHSTIEPHGAVAWGAAMKFRQQTGYLGRIICFETAHPGKFPERLRTFGIEPELPECISTVLELPEGRRRFWTVNNYQEAKDLVVQIYRVERGRQGLKPVI
ncbi:hypothetical protein HYU11_04120 [Candidatus Woesearchaeota archaeon]|nr:hypothetical protein [Candidatus Woesearchaeota archaeon]